MKTSRVSLFGIGIVSLLLAACTPSPSTPTGTAGTNGGAGTAGITCTTGTACGQSCVNTATDNNNCGMCGNLCGIGQSCQASQCVCQTGLILCNGLCVQSDANHCGTCTMTCSAGQVCSNNACTSEGCTGSQMMCGTACVDTTGSAGTGAMTPSMVLVTSASGNYWKTGTLTESTATATVTVNDTSVGQKWDGFGGAFNELGWTYLT